MRSAAGRQAASAITKRNNAKGVPSIGSAPPSAATTDPNDGKANGAQIAQSASAASMASARRRTSTPRASRLPAPAPAANPSNSAVSTAATPAASAPSGIASAREAATSSMSAAKPEAAKASERPSGSFAAEGKVASGSSTGASIRGDGNGGLDYRPTNPWPSPHPLLCSTRSRPKGSPSSRRSRGGARARRRGARFSWDPSDPTKW